MGPTAAAAAAEPRFGGRAHLFWSTHQPSLLTSWERPQQGQTPSSRRQTPGKKRTGAAGSGETWQWASCAALTVWGDCRTSYGGKQAPAIPPMQAQRMSPAVPSAHCPQPDAVAGRLARSKRTDWQLVCTCKHRLLCICGQQRTFIAPQMPTPQPPSTRNTICSSRGKVTTSGQLNAAAAAVGLAAKSDG